jgi:hypothetical protein
MVVYPGPYPIVYTNSDRLYDANDSLCIKYYCKLDYI